MRNMRGQPSVRFLRFLGARVVRQMDDRSRIYGTCWLHHGSECSVVAPFGLHLLIRWGRMLYWRWASFPSNSMALNKAYISELIHENHELRRQPEVPPCRPDATS